MEEFLQPLEALIAIGRAQWEYRKESLDSRQLTLPAVTGMLVVPQLMEQIDGAAANAAAGRVSAASANLRAGMEAMLTLAYVARPDDEADRQQRALGLSRKELLEKQDLVRRLLSRAGHHELPLKLLKANRDALADEARAFKVEYGIVPANISAWDLCIGAEQEHMYWAFMSNSAHVHTNLSELGVRVQRQLDQRDSHEHQLRALHDACTFLLMGLDAFLQLVGEDPSPLLDEANQAVREANRKLNENYPLKTIVLEAEE